MRKLLKEFKEMDRLPIFEIKNDGQWHVVDVIADEQGLYAHGVTVEWDEDFPLDIHLEWLFDKVVKEIIREDTFESEEA